VSDYRQCIKVYKIPFDTNRVSCKSGRVIGTVNRNLEFSNAAIAGRTQEASASNGRPITTVAAFEESI